MNRAAINFRKSRRSGITVMWVLVILSVLAATFLLYLHRRFVQKRPITGPGARRLPR